MRGLVFMVVLAGCGAKLADDPSAHATTDAPNTADIDGSMLVHPDASTPVDARPCSGGNIAVQGTNACFVLFSAPASWAEAKAACVAFGAHLAILDTAAADLVVETMLTIDAFVGATDQVTEGQWLWVDGTPLGTYTNWRSGEPNNGGGGAPENCMVVAGSKAGKGWDDKLCAPSGTLGSYPYVCEY